MSFEATCTCCGHAEVLTDAEANERVDARGYFLCDECVAAGRTTPDFARPRRSRKGEPQTDRRMGCTVTAMLPDGRLASYTQAGKTSEALADICARLPPGSYVETVSTHRTIAADLKNGIRKDWTGQPDPWGVERTMLGRIGRLDLLHPKAAPNYPRRQRA